MNNVCTITGADELSATLRDLSSAIRGKAMLDALSAGAKVLQSETKKNLVARMGSSATRKGLRWRKGHQGHPSMQEGVSMIRDTAYNTAIVSIMRDFRLKWFEKGTDHRWTGGRKKDGRYAGQTQASNYRGAIRPIHFFREARNQETKIETAIFESLDKTINKILK